MVYQICPICDQKLKKRNYCSNCRKRIRKPLTIDVNYYLNERHPETEHDCTYHDYNGYNGYDTETSYGQSAQGSAASSSWQGYNSGKTASPQQSYGSGKNASPRQSYGSGQNTSAWQGYNSGQNASAWQGYNSGQNASSIPNVPRSAQGNRSYRNASSAGRNDSASSASVHMKIAVFIIMIIIFSMVIASITNTFLKTYQEFSRSSPDWDPDSFLSDDSYDFDDDFDDDEYWETELSDEDVLAAGKRCTGYGHFQITADELSSSVIPFIEDLGYADEDSYSDSYNTADSFGDTYYNSYTSTSFSKKGAGDSDDFPDNSLEIDRDTFSGEVHSFSLSWENPREMISILNRITADLRGAGDWPLSEADTADWLDEIEQALNDEDVDKSFTPEELAEYGIDVYIHTFEGSYRFVMYNWGS